MIGSRVLAGTNIFIDLMKGDTAIAKNLESFNTVYISPIVLSELYFGAYRSDNSAKHLAKITVAVQNSQVLAIDAATAEIYVSIKLALLAKGNPISENDIWIAASALQHNLLLYANDNHFRQVGGVQLFS
jgi:tRNA(fMet)-specific endonuclease VapC